MKSIGKNFLKMFLPLLFGICVVAISLTILQPYMATKHQIYDDIILDPLAPTGTNKSGELFSVWFSLFLGTVTMFGYQFFYKKNKITKFEIEDIRLDFTGIGFLFVPIIFILVLKQEINFYLMIIGIIYFISYIYTNGNKVLSGKILLILFSIYFSVLSFKAIIDKISTKKEIVTPDIVIFLTLILFIFIIYFLKKGDLKKIDDAILKLQFMIPLIFIGYLVNKYEMRGKIYKISYTNRYIALIFFFIMVMIISNIIQFIKYKKKKSCNLVYLSSVVTAFIINWHVEPVYIRIYRDFWHWGEESVPWHQIIIKGVELYKNYNGVSGLFGMVHSSFLNLILDGNALSDVVASSLVNGFWALSIGVLLYFLVGDKFSLILALLIPLPSIGYSRFIYNRPFLLVVSILVLALPKLIKSRFRWLQVYSILSILSFLYYPLNGVAMIISLCPFAIVQLYYIFKEKLWKKEVKVKRFWLFNVVIIFTLIKLFKYIMGAVQNIRMLSSKIELSDGLTLYGESIPSTWFLNFLETDSFLRKQLWYLFVFLVIVTVALVLFYFLYLYLRKFKISKLQTQEFLILSSLSISLILNYTYSIVRMGFDLDFSKTRITLLVFIGIIFNIFLFNNKLLSKNMKIILIGLSIGFSLMIQGTNLGNERYYIKRVYAVSEDFDYIDGQEINAPNLGRGFMLKKYIDMLKIASDNIHKNVYNDEKFWENYNREYYLIFDNEVPTKLDSMELTRSAKSSFENLKLLKQSPPPLLMNILKTKSYYMFRWVVDSGYIMYEDKGQDFWLRPDRYERNYGNLKEGYDKMYDIYPQQDFKKMPYSFGNSMKSLSSRFISEKLIDINKLIINYNQISKVNDRIFKIDNTEDPFIMLFLSEEISGRDYDFIYIKFSSNIKNKNLKDKGIQLFWESRERGLSENRSVRFNYGNGQLLIPMGLHPGWTASNIIMLRFDFEGISAGTELKIEEIKFIKFNSEARK
jgi:hypothetical protein